MPSLDMGGKAGPGRTLLARLARDKKGKPIGDALGPHGTPKCQYHANLCKVDDYEPLWIGAHPRLGEDIAKSLVPVLFPAASSVDSQVTINDSRIDYVVNDGDTKTLLEVKTVVDTDYDPASRPGAHLKNVFFGASPYERAAIFPWGEAKQKTPDGVKCVSARAIKHIHELARAARGSKFKAAMLFVVVRHDAMFFRPNYEACPAFAAALRDARDSGVALLARRIRWVVADSAARAFDDGPLEVRL